MHSDRAHTETHVQARNGLPVGFDAVDPQFPREVHQTNKIGNDFRWIFPGQMAADVI